MMQLTSPTASGMLKRKGAFFGIWKDCYCELEGNNFNVMTAASAKRPPSDRKIERHIIITPETRITLIPDQPRFQIEADGEPPLLLCGNDDDDVRNWVLYLRGVTYSSTVYSMDMFDILSVIGRGFYGKVMLVRSKENHELYAIKTVHKARLVQANKVNTILAERNILVKARHPFIVGLCFAFQTQSKFYLGLEYVPGGELFRHAKSGDNLDIEETRFYVAQVALALEHLHSIGVVYRDLKPENILLCADGYIKLADFGLSKDVSIQEVTSTFCGTSEYLAPEIIRREPYSFMIDWWALGILTYELLYGSSPFYNKNRAKMFQLIVSEQPTFPEGADPNSIDFILKLLVKDPHKRSSFDTLRNHPFWGNLSLDDVLSKKIRPKFVPSIDKDHNPTNFDSEFTAESPTDSVATPTCPPTPNAFQGFSFAGASTTITDYPSSEIVPPPPFEPADF